VEEELAGLPTGVYVCSQMAEYVGEIFSGTSVTVLPGGRYQLSDGASGEFAADDTSTVRWLSGPFAGGDIAAEVIAREDGNAEISLVLPDATESCLIR
jgi:hypothetical protein